MNLANVSYLLPLFCASCLFTYHSHAEQAEAALPSELLEFLLEFDDLNDEEFDMLVTQTPPAKTPDRQGSKEND